LYRANADALARRCVAAGAFVSHTYRFSVLFAACDRQCVSGCSHRGAGYCDTNCSSPRYGLASNFTCQRMFDLLSSTNACGLTQLLNTAEIDHMNCFSVPVRCKFELRRTGCHVPQRWRMFFVCHDVVCYRLKQKARSVCSVNRPRLELS
jgi:hypothetical protein